ncbi:hypothetical protein V2G26_007306 [Clonostachys chloroleuca]
MDFPKLLAMAFAAMHLALPSVAQHLDPCKAVAKVQLESGAGLKLERPADLQYNALFDAEQAYQCAMSVPLDAEAATQMISIAKQYFSFMSTLAYLKNPPKSYQQPAIDVMGRLEEIADKVRRNVYTNQYELDLDIHSIIIGVHDTHFSFQAGVLHLFQWFLPDSIVTVSTNGQEVPQVYAYSDIINQVNTASPLVEIEGESIFTYLRSYAARTSMGLNDPHAEWNMLMFNPAFQFGTFGATDKLSKYPDFFQKTVVYNGPTLRGRFANGTGFEWAYSAGSMFNLTAHGLLSGPEIYKNHILNPNAASSLSSKREKISFSAWKPPVVETESLVERGTPLVSSAITTATKVPFDSYPANPIVTQENFTAGGTVSGYFLADVSIGVLSLPSFASSPDIATGISFGNAVASFIKQAKAAGMKKIIIDLSGNAGGSVFLGYDTFKRFFPTIEPSLAWRARASRSVNTIGSLLTKISLDNGSVFSRELINDIRQSGNMAQLNAAFTLDTDKKNWASWKEFYGPLQIHGDNFTKPGFYNLSNPLIAGDIGRPIAGYSSNPLTYQQPWAAEDIVLLQDGYCGSTCTIFSNIMKNDAGVKSVVVGGIPQNGPMQGVCGTRGSNVLKWSDYDLATGAIRQNISSSEDKIAAVLKGLGVTTDDITELPAPISSAPWKIGDGRVNALDEINLSSREIPRQFVYEAANCRLFYTADMIRDITQLWRAAGSFANGNTSVCVPGSTDGPGSGRNQTITDYPGFSYNETWDNANSTRVPGALGGGGDNISAAVTNRVGFTALVIVFAIMSWC